MAQQNRIGVVLPGFCNNLCHRQRSEFRIEQSDFVAGIRQRATQRKQPERWQMFVRYPASNGRMRWIEE